MSEVSVVSQFVRSVIAFAIGAACCGTLGDLVFSSKKDAESAYRRGGMSYGEWNRRLHTADVERHPTPKPAK